MSNAYVEEVSQTIAYSMFRGSKVSQSNIGLSYKLETYLVSADNKFLHPNAIRYMLIKILDLMKKQKDTKTHIVIIATLLTAVASMFAAMPCIGPQYEPELPEELIK